MNSRTAIALDQPVDARPTALLPVVFTATVFWASALLFLLEPMFAKMILPIFGGSPAVWITSMVFFQAALLAAYIYSHYVTAKVARRSIVTHAIAVFAPVLVLPIGVRMVLGMNTIVNHPAIAVLVTAVVSIGLPFFMVGTTAPLLQQWFSQTAHPKAADPYFLYAASNAGSLVGLALYLAVIEPHLRTSRQGLAWSLAYGVFAILTVLCGLAVSRSRVTGQLAASDEGAQPAPALRQKLLWAALAFIPSSLLYGVTAQLSTDFPPIPLLWVFPLALYLLTFIVAFSGGFARLRRSVSMLPTVIVAAMVIFLLAELPWGFGGVIKLACFALIAFAFHDEVARRRPNRRYLTEYFLWIAGGGILGGLLNAFIAPAVFSDFWEYPITLILAAALLPLVSGISRRPVNLRIALSLLAVMAVAGVAMRTGHMPVSAPLRLALLALGALLCMRVPLRWTAIALLVLCVSLGRTSIGVTLSQSRSFFGRYRVSTDAQNQWHYLIHGNTIHGIQRMDDRAQRLRPRSYYGPAKMGFDALADKPGARIAVVGLGAGTMACFAASGQTLNFFEIDPLVERIARSGLFTFLSECPAHTNVVLGDARLTMADAPPHVYDLIVVDAFTSDAVPVHLLTREAFRLYREKLTSDGLLLANISNRYTELAPVIAGSGARSGYETLIFTDMPSGGGFEQGHLPSQWALLVPAPAAPAFAARGWKPFTGQPIVWTDDYSSVFRVIRWRNVAGATALRTWLSHSAAGNH